MNTYKEELEVLNHQKLFNDEKDKLRETLKQNKLLKKKQRDEILDEMETWYVEFLTAWNKSLKRCVIASIQNGNKDKMKKNTGVFNFSNETLTEEANEILKLGKKQYHQLKKEKKICCENI